MQESVRRIKVFVASPGDVNTERNQLPKVIQEINLIISAIAPEKKIVLDLIRWETHTHPNMATGGAQPVIDQQLPDYDIFIGIMWKRFGTPTISAESGTEHEFKKAYSIWESNNKFPVLFYFSQSVFSPPKSFEEIEQLGKVIKFKENLSTKGLIWEYADPSGFADIIRPHLILVLSRMFATGTKVSSSEEVKQLTTENDISIVRERVKRLSKEYEELRTTMSAGDDRTKLMTVVESKMRAIALQIFPLLSELTNGTSAGDRLAAVATLKELPDPKYLTWLANRIGSSEKPFIGFHASVGLLTASRVLRVSHNKEVKAAINMAISNLANSSYKDPNQVNVLNSAKNELGYHKQ